MPGNPMEPIRTLGQQLQEAVKPLGLHLAQFMVAPTFDPDAPDRAMCVFMIEMDEVGKDPDQAQFDEQFVALARQLRDETLDEALQASGERLRQRLERRAQEGDSLLGGDDNEPA